MSSEIKRRMLRAMVMNQVTLRTFTEGEITLAMPVQHIERYARELIADGLVAQAGDHFTLTDAGIAHMTRPTTKAEPRVWCAASVRGTYTPSPWVVRVGADDHLRHKSLGIA
jgi:hypothetical protein